MNNIIAKFNTPASAKGFSAKAKKSYRLFLGDDEKIWVVTMAEGEKLLKQGYEEISAF
ncbi:MAG TPA: hypothetical protein PKY59_12635 [Pyrinomonadaceae bacterium]|nr:hypothetical protein [Pyrinomonadaceae bacterium]